MSAAAVLLSAAWFTLVVEGAARWRPAPARVGSLLPVRPPWARPAWWGDARVHRWALAGAAGAVGYAVLPVLAPVLAVAAWAIPVVRARRRAGAFAADVRR
ncbi:MAG: hypothetical protein QOF37_725, partial [Thermoleophilaceae bacterium]|nr:hypothetical protein [Thermoleophilaceae bacterium]